MTPRVHRVLSGLSLAALATVAVGATASPALAAGDVEVVNTETVQIYTSPTGAVQESRVYEQLSMYGKGAVDVKNPVSTDHLRNLNGFGGFDVKDGDQVVKTTVDGTKKVRSVSSYDGKLPLDVKVAYKLDGKSVKPGDVVGGDGKLEVVYTVENITGKTQDVQVPDGKGGTVTKSAEVAIPIVGSLTTTTPSSFTNVDSKQANRAGDGKGGTKLSFTMTLFPPIGSTTAVFGYTADITDGVIPRAEISALPVNPLDVPTFKSANASYQGGADTGAKLTDGAIKIDDNLLKLRDGAGQLLAGLIKLRDGAGELNAGLSGKAAPGAQKLATGAGDLNDGLGQIDDGTGQLTDGTGKLDAGANKLANGLSDLAGKTPALNDGATRIAAGQQSLLEGVQLLDQGLQTLPATVAEGLKENKDYLQLIGTLKLLSAKIGSPNAAPDTNPATATLFSALNALKYGLKTPFDYSAAECLKAAQDDPTAKCGVADSLQTVSDGLTAAANGVEVKKADLEKLRDGATQIYNYVASTSGGACAPTAGVLPPPAALGSSFPPCAGAAKVAYGIGGPGGVIDSSDAGAVQLRTAAAGLTKTRSKIVGLIVPGIDSIKAKINNPGALADCKAAAASPSPLDDCGLQQAIDYIAADAIPALVDGLSQSISQKLLASVGAPAGGCKSDSKTLLCGASALADGGSQLQDGTEKLQAGSVKLDDGGSKLAAGTGDLDEGAQKLADGVSKAFAGSGLLADGAQTLSDGLQDAANGSGKLADGLVTAAKGAPKLENGAQRLSDEGTKKLIEAGESTTQSYGEMVAVMKAGAERADAEKMAYGAPADAVGLTAYSYVIKGDDGETGRNWARGLGGLALLGAGGGVFALRRRIF